MSTFITAAPVQKGTDLHKGHISRHGLLFLAALLVIILTLFGCGGDASTADLQTPGVSPGTETATVPGTDTGTGTGTATLTWSAPTTNVDGTPLTTLAGYKVYYGTTPGVYTSIVVGNVSSYQLAGLNGGQTYYFTVTAYDSLGIESDFAPVVSKPIS